MSNVDVGYTAVPETVSSAKIEEANAAPAFTDEEYAAALTENAVYDVKCELGAALAATEIKLHAAQEKIAAAIRAHQGPGTQFEKYRDVITTLTS